jgi:hypothetical protein
LNDKGRNSSEQRRAVITWDEDLSALLVMFHDFEVIEVHQQGHELTLRVIIPWGQMLEPPLYDYTITVVLAGCSALSCTYSTLKTDPENLAKAIMRRGSDDWTTSDVSHISALGLKVQSHHHTAPDHYTLYCNTEKSMHGGHVAGGVLEFQALAFKLYDASGKEMERSALQKWGEAWWKSIDDGRESTWTLPT